ncbi:MAG: hypothetical protein EOM23_06455 [Candidatus Moranbacteria bacterium]|nr:hypothetical protein [Candidatus Moranbacteria bacterium]
MNVEISIDTEIVKEYLNGKSILYREKGTESWFNYFRDAHHLPALGSPKYDWKIKPKLMKFKVSLWKSLSGSYHFLTVKTAREAIEVENSP